MVGSVAQADGHLRPRVICLTFVLGVEGVTSCHGCRVVEASCNYCDWRLGKVLWVHTCQHQSVLPVVEAQTTLHSLPPAHSSPASVTTNVWALLEATVRTLDPPNTSSTPEIFFTSLSLLSPRPSCPEGPQFQAQRAQLSPTAMMWACLEATVTILLNSNSNVGISLSCSLLWPRQPHTPQPNVHTSPSADNTTVD
jgi:hypothetical protein